MLLVRTQKNSSQLRYLRCTCSGPILKNVTPPHYRKSSTSSRSEASNPKPDRLRGTGVGADSRLYGKDVNVVGRSDLSTPQQNSTTSIPEQPTSTIREKSSLFEGDSSHEKVPAPTSSSSSSQITSKLQDSSRSKTLPVSDVTNTLTEPTIEKPSSSAEDKANDGYGPEETIYTGKPQQNPYYVLAFSLVGGIYCFSAADMLVAFAPGSTSEEEPKSYVPWGEYTSAALLCITGLGFSAFGAFIPSKTVMKIGIRRPLKMIQENTSMKYPRKSLLMLYTPPARIPGVGPRTIVLDKLRLLGRLTPGKQWYHPPKWSEGPKPFLKVLTVDVSRRKFAPIAVHGERFTYNMDIRRGKENVVDDRTGSWCEDWEELERAILLYNLEDDMLLEEAASKPKV